MQKQPTPNIKMTHNIIWRKWQRKKAAYDQQRSQQSIDQIRNRRFITEPVSEPMGIIQEENQAGKARKNSFQQFVNRIGTEGRGIGDMGWLKVGRPNSYYISCPKRTRKTIDITNPESEAGKKMIHSSASRTYQRVKTESQFHLYERRSSRLSANNLAKNIVASKIVTSVNTNNSTPKLIKRRKSSGLQFRPWSGVDKESIVDFLVHRLAQNP